MLDGNKVRVLREKRKLTQHELAMATGMQDTIISRLEGMVSNAKITTVLKIAKALDCPVKDILSDGALSFLAGKKSA